MSLEDNVPMHYTEVGENNFDQMMQEAFIKAHRIASEYNQKVEIAASIQVFPPDVRTPSSGNVSFSVQLKEPKYTSQRFTTALVGGLPVQDGKNVAVAEQYNMFSSKPTIINSKTEKPEVINGTKNNGNEGNPDSPE